MRRHPTLAISAGDLAELHRYLKLFTKVYDDVEAEAEKLILAVRERFCEQTKMTGTEAGAAMDQLRNPRQAGRKTEITCEQKSLVMKLREDGLSIRTISERTKIPKSTVQRIISRK